MLSNLDRILGVLGAEFVHVQKGNLRKFFRHRAHPVGNKTFVSAEVKNPVSLTRLEREAIIISLGIGTFCPVSPRTLLDTYRELRPLSPRAMGKVARTVEQPAVGRDLITGVRFSEIQSGVISGI